MKTYSIPECVKAELNKAKADWHIKAGGKHGKLIVNNQFCAILSHGRGSHGARAELNIRSQVRRALAK